MRLNKKDFRTLSSKKCKDCRKPLKQNLVDKNPDAERCYKCTKGKREKEILANYRTVKAPQTDGPIILSNFSRDAAGNMVNIH